MWNKTLKTLGGCVLPVSGIFILAVWATALGQTEPSPENHMQTEVPIKGKIVFVSNRPGSASWIIQDQQMRPLGERFGQSRFSRDGNMLFTVTTHRWAHLDLTTRKETFFSKERRRILIDYDWSPDGQKICFTETEQDPSKGLNGANIHVENVDGTGLRCLTNFPADWVHGARNPRWSPDGQLILFVAFDPKEKPSDPAYLWTIRSDGTDLQKIRLERAVGADVIEPAWSPDGSKIAFVSYEPDDRDDYELYVCNIDGSGVRRLTNNRWNERNPTFSPDGKQICFVSYRHVPMGMAGFGSELFIINVDGTVEQRLTPPQEVPTAHGGWAGDDYPTWGP